MKTVLLLRQLKTRRASRDHLLFIGIFNSLLEPLTQTLRRMALMFSPNI